MVRIAVITPYFPIKQEWYRGHSAYQTIMRMAQRTDVQVFCPLAFYPRTFEPRSYRYYPPVIEFSPPGVHTRYVPYPSFPVLSRPFNGLVCYRYLLPLVRAWSPSIILNYWLYPEGYSATKIAMALQVPCIVGAIGSDLCAPKDPFTTALIRKTLTQASATIVVSEDLRQRALLLGARPERTWTIPNGCDKAIFHPKSKATARSELGLRNEDQIVLFVGSLTTSKGIFELITAIESLRTHSQRIKLLIIGEGRCLRTLYERLKNRLVADGIQLLGRRTADEIAQYLCACDVFCLPSHREGCPNAIIEAICSGRPVVASCVGGIPELLAADCGFIVNPGDAMELAEALRRALERDWNPMQISKQFGRTWEDVAEEILNVCQRVSDAHNRVRDNKAIASQKKCFRVST